MRTRSLLVPTLLAAILAGTGARAQNLQPSISLQLLQGKPVVEGVLLNGKGPYKFVLDTGSQTNQLDEALARKLGLPATFQVGLRTPSGSSAVRGGRIGKVTLGWMQAGDQEFLFTSFQGLGTQSPDVRGVLGQEFLSRFDYTLDLQHHRLSFGAPPATGLKMGVRLIYGRMAVATDLGDLVLDSGVEMLFLFRNSLHPVTAEVMSTSGLTAPIAVEAAPAVRIGGRLFHPGKAEFHAVPEAEEAGLLPANIFRAIFISNSGRYIVLNP